MDSMVSGRKDSEKDIQADDTYNARKTERPTYRQRLTDIHAGERRTDRKTDT
jgi:hypothetical protein